MSQTVPLSIIRSFSLYTQEWYMSYMFADSLRAVSNSADTYADQGLTPSPDAKAKGGRGQQASRGHLP